MSGRHVLSALAAAMAMLYLSSTFIGIGYADSTGTFSDTGHECSIDVNSTRVEITDGNGVPLTEPMFNIPSINYTKDDSGIYHLEQDMVFSGTRGIMLSGTGGGFTFSVSYERVTDYPDDPYVQFQIALSESDSGNGLVYIDIPVSGDPVLFYPTDENGNSVEEQVGTLYYMYLRIKAATIPSAVTHGQYVTLTFGASFDGRDASYIAAENTVMRVGISEVIHVTPPTSDEGDDVVHVTETVISEGDDVYTGAEIWYKTPEENTESGDLDGNAVSVGPKTSELDVTVDDGITFCVLYEIYKPQSSNKDVAFTVIVSFTDNSGTHTLSYTFANGINVALEKKYLGMSASPNSLVGFDDITSLDGSSAWLGGGSAKDISITIQGNLHPQTDSKGGYVKATIVVK